MLPQSLRRWDPLLTSARFCCASTSAASAWPMSAVVAGVCSSARAILADSTDSWAWACARSRSVASSLSSTSPAFTRSPTAMSISSTTPVTANATLRSSTRLKFPDALTASSATSAGWMATVSAWAAAPAAVCWLAPLPAFCPSNPMLVSTKYPPTTATATTTRATIQRRRLRFGFTDITRSLLSHRIIHSAAPRSDRAAWRAWPDKVQR